MHSFLKFIERFILCFNFTLFFNENVKGCVILLKNMRRSDEALFILIFLTEVCGAKVTQNEKWPPVEDRCFDETGTKKFEISEINWIR